MTPSEKGNAIYQKMKLAIIDDSDYEQRWWHIYAKSRAEICCDEILNLLEVQLSLQLEMCGVKIQKEAITYYNAVKTHIQQL